MVGQRHEKMLLNQTRAGYFCGDGTGVGKGRQIAAIIAGMFWPMPDSVWYLITYNNGAFVLRRPQTTF